MPVSSKKAATTRATASPNSATSRLAKVDGQSQNASKASSYKIEVIEKTASILGVFSVRTPSLGLAEISSATGIPKTTSYRILTNLVEIGFCEFDVRTEKYSLGFYLLHLATIRQRQTSVHSVAMPIMRELRDATGETVVLSVRSGDTRVHIDAIEGLHAMRRTADLGVSAPLYAGAASKVLLAGMEDREISSYLAATQLTKFQKNTITSTKSLWAEIERIRQRGYAESKGELISGGGALAAPLKDHTGRTVGVIDILTPDSRYTGEHREKCIQLLIDGARRCSERLGYRQ